MDLMAKSNVKFEQMAEKELTEDRLRIRECIFIPTTLKHDDVVAKKDYLATTLKTSALATPDKNGH